eukprot:gnl/TRDRNA2_/TRDRNA2_94362_c0_seq1.p1 gnl/TRDRNA2_/TRDRNA2_94362_c0~~gnl/TRDRNA2_/TRDRNA2_94362_c0_seq1.p1  ORF type:complete len:350 (+),score=63.16 gnl/TRDRNA2_/TRDRNA2_94362_c0_seq1:77-1126(+)
MTTSTGLEAQMCSTLVSGECNSSSSDSNVFNVSFLGGDVVQLERTGLSTVADVRRVLQELGKVAAGTYVQFSVGTIVLPSESSVTDIPGDLTAIACKCRDKLLISIKKRTYRGPLVELHAPDDADKLVQLQPFLEKLPFGGEVVIGVIWEEDESPVTTKIRIGNTAQRNDKGTWNWTFYINSATEVWTRGRMVPATEYIEEVIVTLHETFKNPVRKLQRPTLQLSLSGWGTFELKVDIRWRGGKQTQTTWLLRFDENQFDFNEELEVPAEVIAESSLDRVESDDECIFDEIPASAMWSMQVTWGDEKLTVRIDENEHGPGSGPQLMRAWASFEEELLSLLGGPSLLHRR